jgi:DNA-binding GntR family transcriptional regulator
MLTEEGLIRFVPGKGLYVANPEVIEPWIREQKRKR